MSNLQTNIPLVNIPFVDDTGRVAEPWFLFLVQLFRRTGGADPTGELTLADVLSLEETFAPIVSPDTPLAGEITLASRASSSYSASAVPVTLGASPAQYKATYPQGFYISGSGITSLSLQRGSTVLPISSAVADMIDAQPTFTAGVSTSVTLPAAFGSISRLWVYFDGVFQGDDQIASLVGTTLTFTSAVPVGTNKVYVKGLSETLGNYAPLELSIGDIVNVSYTSLPSVTVLPR